MKNIAAILTFVGLGIIAIGFFTSLSGAMSLGSDITMVTMMIWFISILIGGFMLFALNTGTIVMGLLIIIFGLIFVFIGGVLTALVKEMPSQIPQISQIPQSSQMPYCSKCGAQLSSGFKYCMNCGQPVTPPP